MASGRRCASFGCAGVDIVLLWLPRPAHITSCKGQTQHTCFSSSLLAQSRFNLPSAFLFTGLLQLSRARDVTGNLARALELTGPAAAAAAAAATAAEEGGERDLSASQVFGPSAGRKAE